MQGGNGASNEDCVDANSPGSQEPEEEELSDSSGEEYVRAPSAPQSPHAAETVIVVDER